MEKKMKNNAKKEENQSHNTQMNMRIGEMILSAMVVMHALMLKSAWNRSHVRWSESRVFMMLTMGGSIGLVMLGWMLNMYQNQKINMLIFAASILLLAGAVYLDRSQTTVQDTSFMSAMIPHHSMAITRSERAEIMDQRVCELAVEISEAQRREILEMEWLIEDIKENGLATTIAAAEARSVPYFEVSAERLCRTD